jgi:ceramide glucosyltransferase
MGVVSWLLLALVAGAFVFSLLVVVATRDYKRVRPPVLARPEPISILKPLAGLDEGLEENLRSYFRQDYPAFELLFAVHHAADPAAAVVEKLRGEFPDIPARLIVTGEPPWANPKDYSLELMLAQARYDLLVMSDSDTRAGPDMLSAIAAEFQDANLGLASCPYRAVAGRDFWSRLEAIGLNTEMLAGVLAGRLLEGMKFGLGPVMAARRKAIQAIGGFARVKDYPADDFVLGRFVAEQGIGAILSSCVVEHRLGTQTWRENLEHRLRWLRACRRMRPAGYFGQVFTYPLPLALLLWAVRPDWWPASALALAAHALAVGATAGWVLRDPVMWRRWWLVPLEDLLSFAFWIAGFFGNTVSWRGRRYILNRDGTFRPVPAP